MAKMKSFLGASFVSLSLLFAFAASADTSSASWAGEYVFEGDYGRTAGGTPMFITYTLNVKPAGEGLSGEVKAEGWQTWAWMECEVKVEGKQLVFYFVRNKEGGFLRIKKGDRLLALEKVSSKKFLAVPAAMGIEPEPNHKNIYFVRRDLSK